MQKTFKMITLGCKVNQYESEAIAEALEKYGMTPSADEENCNMYIINSCTVTAESDRKSAQLVRQSIRKNPNAFVIVTGCSAQYDAQRYASIDGVDAVIGNRQKMLTADVARSLIEGGKKPTAPIINVPDLRGVGFENTVIKKFDRTRAYIKIEDGCESHCAYCTIPRVRGDIRSKPFDDVIFEVTDIVKNGCGEVVLTGIETGSYGRDIGGVTLADLMERIDKIDGIGRVRTGSLDPASISPDFARRIANLKSAAPHFHLSLQSGSSRVLALMRRKYNADMAYRAMQLLRDEMPEVNFTTDVIVGFPGEGEAEFEETLAFAHKARFLKIHVFPYSKRAGTEAATMKNQVPEEIKKQRVHILSQLESEIREDILTEYLDTHKSVPVLFETYRGGYAYGHTASFIEVAVRSESPLAGQLLDVTLTRRGDGIIYGKI